MQPKRCTTRTRPGQPVCSSRMPAAAGSSESGSAGRRCGMWVSATTRPPPPPTCGPGNDRGTENRQILLHLLRSQQLSNFSTTTAEAVRSKPHRVQLAQQALRVGRQLAAGKADLHGQQQTSHRLKAPHTTEQCGPRSMELAYAAATEPAVGGCSGQMPTGTPQLGQQ